jgi:hypothetical protein
MSSEGLVSREWGHFQGNITAILEDIFLNDEILHNIK